MLRASSAILVAALTFPAALPIQAQDEQRSAQADDDARPYVSPPARKSVEVGDYYRRRKKYRAALSRYQEAVQTDPYCAEGYLGLGRVYEKIGLKRKALENYQKYLDLLPSAKQADQAKSVQEAIARLEKEGTSSLGRSSSGATTDRHQ